VLPKNRQKVELITYVGGFSSCPGLPSDRSGPFRLYLYPPRQSGTYQFDGTGLIGSFTSSLFSPSVQYTIEFYGSLGDTYYEVASAVQDNTITFASPFQGGFSWQSAEAFYVSPCSPNGESAPNQGFVIH